MAKRSAGADSSAILAVVIELLETRGTEGWQLREVAERLRMSLSTLYKFFPSRDELIVAAVELWMEQHVFQPIEAPAPDQPVFEALNVMFHALFEPWEEHPEMLHVYIRTANAGASDRFRARGREATKPAYAMSARLDPFLAADVDMILTNVTEGALARFAKGEIAVTDILPTLERTLIRLEQAADGPPASSAKAKRHPRGDAAIKHRRAASSK